MALLVFSDQRGFRDTFRVSFQALGGSFKGRGYGDLFRESARVVQGFLSGFAGCSTTAIAVALGPPFAIFFHRP